MRAVVFHGIGDIRLDEVAEPTIIDPTDAIVRITATAICGTDLHMIRGTLGDMEPGTILGHEAVGVIEEVGDDVRDFAVGDRVVIPSTIACGNCSYCRAGYTSKCDVANPDGPNAGTAYFGGPKSSGGFPGLQAEYARVPFANVGLIRLPDDVGDDEAILLSDVFPTGYFAADIARIHPGHTVAVFGCGPVGLFAIASAKLMNAGRIFAIDQKDDRLEMARELGAECIDFSREDPVEVIRSLTDGIGVDRVIEAVGIDAERADRGPALHDGDVERFERLQRDVAPKARPDGGNWHPGSGPTQAVEWALDAVCKAGVMSVVGVYPDTLQAFSLGKLLGKGVELRGGSCHHRKYIPTLLELVRSGQVDPTTVLSRIEPLTSSIEAYEAFDRRDPGWLKVELTPSETQRLS